MSMTKKKSIRETCEATSKQLENNYKEWWKRWQERQTKNESNK